MGNCLNRFKEQTPVSGSPPTVEEGQTLTPAVEGSKVVAEILGKIGDLHWVAGGFTILAYLIEKFEKYSENEAEVLELLRKMVNLAETVNKSREIIPKEKFNDTVVVVVQGSIMCISQIYSANIFRFLKTSVNSKNLKDMSDKLDNLYDDLNLDITTKIAEQQPIFLPLPKSKYPKDAVGIENAQKEVIELLNMKPEDDSTLVVVIYGFGGIGKTTLASAVVATLDSNGHLDEYAR